MRNLTRRHDFTFHSGRRAEATYRRRFARLPYVAVAAAMAVALIPCVSSAAETSTVSPVDMQVENFELRDYRGKVTSLDDVSDAKVVVLVFLGVECPLVKLYAPRLAALNKRFSKQGVAFLGINANQQDSTTEISAFARRHKVPFPILKDVGNVVADRLRAERTPEVFVLDEQRVVRYWGRIDDQYGFTAQNANYQKPRPERNDLAVAVEELLAGKSVSEPVMRAPGCHIGRIHTSDQDAEVTYSNQIARLMNERCVVCHRSGQIAPFTLTNYEEVVGWAEMIREVAQLRRMPPWHADPKIGHFSNDSRLTDKQLTLIDKWVEAGAPEGDPAELPESPTFAEGWQIPEPDEVIYMRDKPFEVPEEGEVEYQHFVVDPGWTEDKWIKAVEARPGNPEVVHHILIFVRTPRAIRRGGAGQISTDWLAAYAPGTRQGVLPAGMARFVPAGSKLIFQQHYTPNGSTQSDRSYLGIVFADKEEIRKEVAVANAGNYGFKIPPNAPNHKVKSSFTFSRDALLLTLMPHMHLRGKDFNYQAIYPDGRREMLLSVPQYDFGWQTIYSLAEPKLMPAGTKLQCVAHFDNSDDNLNNPDPTVAVRFGEQTWDEMMIGFFEIALADQDLVEEQKGYVSRVDQFLTLYKANGTDFDETTSESCRRAFENTESFERFSYALDPVMPQIDRICATYVDENNKLRLYQVTERPPFHGPFRSTSTRYTASRQGLAEYIDRDDIVVVNDLAAERGSVMRKMHAKGIRSSLHVPTSHDGIHGTINFWSLEENAFPPEAIETIRKAVSLIGKES